ncbi:MAG: hypothetical protein NTV70_05040 [Acidobacteria bacterium]|nr:hypothetical protein [Acidobacteriota bacterium]
MYRLFSVSLLMLALSGMAMAISVPVPEIDPGMATNAIALVSGAVLVFRSSRKK